METVFSASSVGATCSGAHLGPDAVKAALWEQGLDKLLDPIVKANITDIVPSVDKDKECQMNHPETVYNNLKETVETVGQTKEDFTLVFGGDHSTGAGTYFGLQKKYPGQRVGVIWFDAHADLNCPGSSDSGNLHGMPVGIMLHRGFTGNELYREYDGFSNEDPRHWWSEMKLLGLTLRHTDLVYVGARDIDEGETSVLERYGIPNFTVDDIKRQGIEKVLEQTLEHLKDCDKIYVSFDVDGMDPSVSRGTGTCVEDGVLFEDAQKMCDLLSQEKKICCFEFAEVNPLLDDNNKMAKAVTQLLLAIYKNKC